jgi:hypothetical protein
MSSVDQVFSNGMRTFALVALANHWRLSGGYSSNDDPSTCRSPCHLSTDGASSFRRCRVRIVKKCESSRQLTYQNRSMTFFDELAINMSAHAIPIVIYVGNDDSLVPHRSSESRFFTPASNAPAERVTLQLSSRLVHTRLWRAGARCLQRDALTYLEHDLRRYTRLHP